MPVIKNLAVGIYPITQKPCGYEGHGDDCYHHLCLVGAYWEKVLGPVIEQAMSEHKGMRKEVRGMRLDITLNEGSGECQKSVS